MVSQSVYCCGNGRYGPWVWLLKGLFYFASFSGKDSILCLLLLLAKAYNKHFCCLTSKHRSTRLAWNHFLSQVTRSLLQINTIKEYDSQDCSSWWAEHYLQMIFQMHMGDFRKNFASYKLKITDNTFTLIISDSFMNTKFI